PREQIVFTSGGTEANLLGVQTLAVAAERRGLVRVAATTSIEHPSLLGAVASLGASGWRVAMLPVSGDARIALGDDERPGVVAIAAVNHELGTIAGTAEGPLAAVVQWARDRGALVHIDAVQAA